MPLWVCLERADGSALSERSLLDPYAGPVRLTATAVGVPLVAVYDRARGPWRSFLLGRRYLDLPTAVRPGDVVELDPIPLLAASRLSSPPRRRS